MSNNIKLDEKSTLVMKLIHYFITEKNYNPIVLQGLENEVWLENLDKEYKVIRIVSNYIHNDEQFEFDIFKTKRILKKIKKKTFSLSLNNLSIFLNLGDNVSNNKENIENVSVISIKEEKDLFKNEIIKEIYPDLKDKLTFDENGIELFSKITDDINVHNKKGAEKMENTFSNKTPYVTYTLIGINIFIYLFGIFMNVDNLLINLFAVYGPLIREGEIYRLFTGMFLHSDIIHLGLNCYVLYIIGSQIENFFGKFKFSIIYILAGLGSSLLSMTFANGSASVGASGAIFGLIGALLYFGYYYRVYLGNVLRSQLVPLVAINLAISFLIPGIDLFGHIGGLITGILVTMALGIDDKTSKSSKINGIIILIIFLVFLAFMAFRYSV